MNGRLTGEGGVSREGERRSEMGVITLGRGVEIWRLPDIHGAGDVYLPRYRPSREADSIVRGLVRGVVEEGLTPLGRSRLEYCLEELRLPGFLAVRAALKSGENLEDYVVPDRREEPTVAVPITGESGLEKSLMTAVASLRTGYPIADFESKSPFSAAAYARYIMDRGKNGSELSFAKAKSTVEEMRLETGVGDRHSGRGVIPNWGVSTLGDILGRMLWGFRGETKRPEVVICDMPGEPRAVRDGGGGVVSYKREHTVYEVMTRVSFESPRVLSTHKLIASQMERKTAWLVDLMKSGLREWRQNWERLAKGVKGNVW